ncbi:MAG: TIGR03769 domain-containing protein, partial [Planctomycetota bacterium]
EDFWILPQNQLAGQLFLGTDTGFTPTEARDQIVNWNPGDPRRGRDVAAPWIGLELVRVDGPAGGEFAMYRSEASEGVVVLMSTFSPQETFANTAHELVGGHTHFSWAFTKAGLYEVVLRANTMIEAPSADVNGDQSVDGQDVSAWLGSPLDVTCDGIVDFFDVARVQRVAESGG